MKTFIRHKWLGAVGALQFTALLVADVNSVNDFVSLLFVTMSFCICMAGWAKLENWSWDD